MVRAFCCLALAIQCFGFCARARGQDDPAGNFSPLKTPPATDTAPKDAPATNDLTQDERAKVADPEFKDPEALRRFLIGLEISTYEATKAKPGPLRDVLADDFTMFNADGTKTNRKQLLETLGEEPVKMSYSNFSVRLLGREGALVTYTTKGPPADPPAVDHGTINTSAWERRDGKWHLVFCQMLSLPGEGARSSPPSPGPSPLDGLKEKPAEDLRKPEEAKKADDLKKPDSIDLPTPK